MSVKSHKASACRVLARRCAGRPLPTMLMLLFAAAAAAEPSAENSFRMMLDGSAGGGSPDKTLAPKRKPGTNRAAPASLSCEQRFQQLRLRVEERNALVRLDFVESRYSWQKRCDQDRAGQRDYEAMAAIAAKCTKLPDHQQLADKYRKFANSGSSEYWCEKLR